MWIASLENIFTFILELGEILSFSFSFCFFGVRGHRAVVITAQIPELELLGPKLGCACLLFDLGQVTELLCVSGSLCV